MTTTPRILVVDDDPHVTEWLVESLVDSGHDATAAYRGAQALELLQRRRFDVVVSDVVMPDMRGTALLEAIQREHEGLGVILITAFGSIDLAVEMVRAGAADFIAKPFPIESLIASIARVMRNRPDVAEAEPPDSDDGLVACSDAMQGALALARRAARSGSVVLLTGESGVGKGALARFIHERSVRRDAPFIQVNCAALPAQLVEAELFGVQRGAYTDARDSRPGLFVEAAGGTLFLDEIGELSPESQPKLLHALESSTVRPVGSATEVAIDVRVIAATNTPIEEALSERRFRPDLYYRLNVIRIDIPPLRDRPEDIAPIANKLMAMHARTVGRPGVRLTEAALRWARNQPWLGNVRELSNVLERAVTLSDEDAIALDQVCASALPRGIDRLASAAAHGVTLAEVEQAYIRAVLDTVGGNIAQAARILAIDRRTVYRKLQGD